MGLDNLYSVTNRAIADGYVSRVEALEIQKYAFKDDNTITSQEKAFLQDAYNHGAYFEPRAKIIMERLVTYGDERISDQMDELRRQKQNQNWFNDEYVQRATPILINSTDSISNRMSELDDLKREANMFNDEYANIGKEIVINSNDSIVERLSALSNLKRNANMFNDDYKEIGKETLLNSCDNKYARLRALDDFKNDAGLWNNEYNEIRDAILHDS